MSPLRKYLKYIFVFVSICLARADGAWARGAQAGDLDHWELFGRGIRAYKAQMYYESEFWFWMAEESEPLPAAGVAADYPESGDSSFPWLPHYFRGLSFLGSGDFQNAKRQFESALAQWVALEDKKLRSGLTKSYAPLLRLLLFAIDDLSASHVALGREFRELKTVNSDVARYRKLRKKQKELYRIQLEITRTIWGPEYAAHLKAVVAKLSLFAGSLRSGLNLLADRGQPNPQLVSQRAAQSLSSCVSRDTVLGDPSSDEEYDKRVAILFSPVKFGCDEDLRNCDLDLSLAAVDQKFDELEKTLIENMGFSAVQRILMKPELANNKEGLLAKLRSEIDVAMGKDKDRPEKNLIVFFYVGHACRVLRSEEVDGPVHLVVYQTSTSPLCSSVPQLGSSGLKSREGIERRKALVRLGKESINKKELEELFFHPLTDHHFVLLVETCFSGDMAQNKGEYREAGDLRHSSSPPFFGLVTSSSEKEVTSAKLPLINRFIEFGRQCGRPPSQTDVLVPGFIIATWLTNQLETSGRLARYKGDEGYDLGEFFLPVDRSCCWSIQRGVPSTPTTWPTSLGSGPSFFAELP